MKNKSTRHKEFNTFKFKPFAERIADIDIDIFHRVGHENEAEADAIECFFYQSMENWSILNLTESFEAFKKEIRHQTLVTLPQLLLDKERVIEVLLKHLKLKNVLSLQPLLDIVVALAKDLRKDFYPYYKDFLEVLIDLLKTKDTEQLEWTFTCLAYIFKFLWRPLLKDITAVFSTLLPLLSNLRPEYIHNFAASSFAFVARKVKDWPTFLSHILKTVKNRRDGVEGCGKLFFEVIHGVNGHFHSCAETVLPFLIESLGNPKFSQNVLFEILEKLVENIVSNIHPQKGGLLEETVVQRAKTLLDTNKDGNHSSELCLILKLLGQTIEYKGGKFLSNNKLVVDLILQVLKSPELIDEVLEITVQIAIVMLLSKNVKLTQEQASCIVRKILTLPQESILFYFVENISEFASFEALVLPIFLSACLKSNLNDDSLKVLIKLILKKSPLSGSGIYLPNWKKYLLDFGSKNNTLLVENVLLNYLNSLDMDHYLAALIILPHLNGTQLDRIQTILSNKISEFILKLETEKEKGDLCELNKVLFLLSNTIECCIHLEEKTYLFENFDTIVAALAPLVSKNLLLALNGIDFLISVFADQPQIISMSNLRKLNTNLATSFCSPYHEIRLTTAHIYSLFENLSDLDLKHSSDPDVPKENFQVFSLCYKIESIDSRVDTYRDQVQILEKFNFDRPQMIMCNKTEFKTIPVRYLCGALYINFKLLWDPILKIIETHAHGLEVAEFWEIFGEELRVVVSKIRDDNETKTFNLEASWSFMNELFQDMQKSKSNSDFVNYRLLLWKAMTFFADVAEIKTRDVVEVFLDFIEKEFTRSNSSVATKWNIKQNSDDKTLEVIPSEENQEETVTKTHKKGKNNIQILLHALAVFSKVRSPKSMYREPELHELYLNFLQHKSSEVQKAALDCLMTYKYKYLTPYKDHLYNLIDDKQLKNELTTFQIDKESQTIQEDHRNQLIPLIMKIVFSKMTAKIGLRTGGKSSGQLRRNLIFRFLSGCQEQEMLSFTKMTFHIYSKFLKDDPDMMVQDLTSIITLETFIPPKRLQSSLNLINVILDQFGGLMGNELLTFLIQIALLIGGILKIAFDHVVMVHAGYLAILRALKCSVIKVIERIFAQFDSYLWTNTQINTIFKVFVWPNLDKLNIESIHSPTALLKLFYQWGCNPRYFSLLVKHEDGNDKQFVLPHVIKLLLNDKSKISVVYHIEEMLEKLLTLQANEDDLQLLIPVDNLLPVAKNILDRIKIDDKLNYGSCILLPFIPSVLEKIKKQLERKKSLNQKELFILSRISELVWESEISDSTLKLLLPQVLKRCSTQIGEEVVVQLLTTVYNLVNNVETPRLHLKQITCLFGEVEVASGRKLLLETLKGLGSKLEIDLVDGLNAFDKKWVDQPDFQRRHDTFKLVQNHLESEEIDLDLGVLLIYNCYFLVKNEKDLSLRENSSHCLKNLCSYLLKRFPNQVNYLLNETIFNLIRRGMKSKHSDFRNECILILGHLARECFESHVVLRDLNLYTNKNDLEVDFFENLTHLQLHRHARALLKFCSVTRDLTSSPNVRTLTQFVLPLASYYLCNEKYVGKNSVIDAAIDCMATICRILPWHQYESLLKFYLSKLKKNVEFQKQLVRITVAILDAFHFDLKKGHVGNQEEENRENGKINDKNSENEKTEDKDVEEENIEDENDQSKKDEEENLLDDEDNLESIIDTDELEEEDIHQEVKICEKNLVLCKSTATRVIRSIQNVLLPQLHKALAELTHHETSHKINRKKTSFEREEEDLLRVPISLALVKLLQRLPKQILEDNLPGIFMKLCTFLKSRLESVRRVTRETLQKIMQTLGPDYLHLLLGEMTPLLNRGFHVHVLVYTVHAVLNCLKSFYKATDIDKILLTVLQLCQADLFGSLSEEKEVTKIAVKTSEAKSTKSFDTLQILAQFVTEKCLMDLILPIKNVLQNSQSFKTVYKAEEALRHIVMGLVENEFLETHSLLIFAYGTASESIPDLIPQEKDKVVKKSLIKKTDCFIIPPAPVGRSGVRISNVKSSVKANFHILVEFGLRLCYVMLKRDKLKDQDYNPFLDPFVPIFEKCLTSKHIKLSTLTLQCLTWVMKYELPSLKENIQSITENIFSILHKYASAGLSKGDNFDLVMAAFKAMAVLVRDVKYYTITIDQLKILLLYAEQDMHDHDRQATAFNLLKSIIARKLIVPEIHEVMSKVAELSITSELSHVRAQSRSVFHQYLMDYPLGEKLEQDLAFYLSQMSYELQFGRESAIEMISTLISSFPMKTLKDHSGTMLVTLGARLVNDDVPECRKQVADCITTMLNRLQKQDREPLFDIVLLWLKDNKIAHRRLAAQLCGIFVSVEKCSFESRLSKILPVVLKQFNFKREKNETKERVRDHFLFQVLQMLLKVCAHCSSFFKMKEINDLNRHVQSLLGYPHDWVRLAAAQYLGYVFATINVEELAAAVNSKTGLGDTYLMKEPIKEVKSLTLDLCDQLQPGAVKSDLAEQVIKNLVFVAKVLAKVQENEKISLLWLTKRMRKIVNSEVVESPSSTILRTEVFKWIAAVSTVLEVESILPIFNHLLAPLVREMITTEESNAPLRQLSKEVGLLLKKKVGMETYVNTLSSLQQILSTKRADRKRSRTQLAVTDPETFAKKKIKRHEKKKESKKRKLDKIKGKKTFKKRKVIDLEPGSEL